MSPRPARRSSQPPPGGLRMVFARDGRPSPAQRLEALYRDFAPTLIRRAAGTLRTPPHAVEDACQIAWARLAGRPDVLDGPSPRGWLLTVALHAYFAEVRDAPLPLTVDPRTAAPIEDTLEAREALRLVAQLRPVRRRVFERRLAGLSYAEIAAELEITYTNVNRQLVDSRAELRRAA